MYNFLNLFFNNLAYMSQTKDWNFDSILAPKYWYAILNFMWVLWKIQIYKQICDEIKTFVWA